MEENNAEVEKKTAKTETVEPEKKKSIIAIRTIIVFLCLAVVSVVSLISFRTHYLSIKEVGNEYTDIFFKTIHTRMSLIIGIFVVTYFIVYINNKIAKHGLKKFFDEDKKKMPKLPNKSLSIISAIIACVFGEILLGSKYTMFMNTAWFGKNDPVFNIDIAYYIFAYPFVGAIVRFIMLFLIFLIIYTALYYVIIMNTYLDGVDIEVLKKNTFIKQIMTIIVVFALFFSVYIFLNSENILTQEMLTLQSDKTIELIGAGKTDVTIKLWGYRIFAVLFFIVVVRLLICVKKANFKHSMISILIIPSYLFGMFSVMIYYDQVIVRNEELDSEKKYIGYNIENTKEAYGIDIKQKQISSYDTITYEEKNDNLDVIENIPIVSSSATVETISEHQEEGIYYSYKNNFLALHDSNLVYITPREILSNSNMSYNNRTFKYTHGYSAVISSASDVDENGYIKYILSDYNSDKIIKEPRIYFGMETNSLIITNSGLGKEFDYPISATNNVENEYEGKAGLNLGIFDRFILGIANKNLKLVFTKHINKDSKIITNRNIRERAKVLLPDIIYDEDPYFVISKEGRLVWVLDGYTVSNEYPYSQITSITVDQNTQKINYIRNSVKVLIDAYDGTTKFYITDRSDPIIMAYRNLYPTLFQDLDEEIPEDIRNQFVYPKLLYTVQSEILGIYHDISEDVLYRADDIWEITPESSTSNSTVVGQKIKPYYTMVKLKDSNEAQLGLVVIYNKKAKQNITSYLVGTCKNGKAKLSLYKFSSESNVAGIVQLNSQIEQDATISAELDSIRVSGTKIVKNAIIVPIEDTLLYVEPVYQIRLNESEIPILKKVIVASGNKVAIGDTLNEAISNLFSDYAVNLEIIDMQEINDVIDAIIKSKGNLDESLELNDFEMIGKDLSKLGSLISRLEVLRKAEIAAEKESERENSKNAEKENTIDENSIIENIINEEELVNELSEQTNSI